MRRRPPRPTKKATASSGNAAKEVDQFHQTVADPLIGKTVDGRYRIEELIGEGGMGNVYRAHDLDKDRDVAVKFLQGEISEAESAIGRFKREFDTAFAVSHRNVVKILDIGRHNGNTYIAMEYVRGDDLKVILRREKVLDWVRAKALLSQLCDTFQAVHENGIVHRDLKPANIMVGNEGGNLIVKLLDFGLAKFVEETTTQDSFTKTGQIIGTFSYMAPEQILGEKQDHRVDIYALGIIMYEMLCGVPPFHDGDPNKKLMMHIHTPPIPPSLRRPDLDIPPGVEKVVMRAIEKEPDKRFQSMKEMKEAVESDGANMNGVESALVRETFRPTPKTAERMPPPPPRPTSIETPRAGLGNRATTVPMRKRGGEEPVRGKKAIVALVGGTIVAMVVAGIFYFNLLAPRNEKKIEEPEKPKQEEQHPVEEAKKPYTVTLKTKPRSAEVYIEEEIGGRPMQRLLGKTNKPLSLALPGGEHTLIIKKRGYQDERIVVTPEENTPEITLKWGRNRRR